MNTYLIILLILLNFSITFSLLTKKKIDNFFCVTIFFIIFILYIFGLFKGLKIGAYVLEFMSILAFIYNIIKIYKEKKSVKKIILTKGLIAFILVYIFLCIIHYGRMFSTWDEFSHWGDVVKVMYNLNDFQTNPLSLSTYKSYPPAMSLFQYFLVFINGKFEEHIIYLAFNIVGFSCLIPFLQKIKSKTKYIISIILLLITPLVFFKNYYSAIYIDPIVAIVFAFGVFFIENIDNKFDLIIIFLEIFCLTLLKDVGLFFSIVIALLQLIKILKKEKTKNNIIVLIIIISAILFSKLSWELIISLNEAKKSFSNSITIQDIYNIIFNKYGDYRNDVIKNFYNALQSEKIIKQFIQLDFIRISIVYLGIFYYMIKNKIVEKSKALIYMSSIYLYCFGLLVIYCTRFSQREAIDLASYSRYLSISLLGIFLIICWNIIKNEKHITILLIITLLFIPYKSIFEIRQSVNDSKALRKPYEIIENTIKEKIDENSKIYIISQNKFLSYRILKYSLRPLKANTEKFSLGKKYKEKDTWTKDISVEEWEDILFDGGYDYVYVYNCDEQFINKYGTLFEEKIKNNNLYKVDKESNKLILYN